MTGKNWKIKNKSGQLLYSDLTEKIIGLCFQIHKLYGSGQKESVYQNLLEEKFSINNISFKREESIKIKSEETGKVVGSHRLDFVIDSKIIIETKAIKFTPVKMEQQLYSYLRNSPYEVGLMINFGSSKLYIRRIILTKNIYPA
jgi:GxxExxY protein